MKRRGVWEYRVWGLGLLTGIMAAVCWSRAWYWGLLVLVVGLFLIPDLSAEHQPSDLQK
jgi:hypothetical protein